MSFRDKEGGGATPFRGILDLQIKELPGLERPFSHRTPHTERNTLFRTTAQRAETLRHAQRREFPTFLTHPGASLVASPEGGGDTRDFCASSDAL